MLEIKNLNCFYGKNKALSDISLTLEDASFTAITGLNGSGKSTLLSCISQSSGYSGKILLDGIDIKSLSPRERAKRLSYLPQHLKSVPFTVRELCSFGRNPYADAATQNAQKLIDDCLERVSLSHLSGKRADSISGGERQLSYFSMILCQNTPCLLLDEPATGMDIGREDKIYSIALEDCKKQKKSVIAVMHNLSNAIKFADRILILKDGRAVFYGTKQQCLDGCLFEEHFDVKRYTSLSSDGTQQIFFAK